MSNVSDDTSRMAAIYARVSTDMQKYSIANQLIALNSYASEKGLKVVDSYIDAGKSGLTFNNRAALKKLIHDASSGSVKFTHVLVLDVSRWGRFQNVDEGAYYEFLCSNFGIKLHYVAEQFQNDETAMSSVLKAMKRIMAAEYSRELSKKVFAGKNRVAREGFYIGGIPGFGLRRRVVLSDGKKGRILAKGERRGFSSEKVILEPGPKKETRLVKWIFNKFLEDGIRELSIVQILNEKGIWRHGSLWSTPVIMLMLRNENYIGNLVVNRSSSKLRTKVIYNPEDTWIRYAEAFPAIIDKELFEKVQKKIADRLPSKFPSMPREALLGLLRELLEKEGELSELTIAFSPKVPSITMIRKTFGSLQLLYDELGYIPKNGLLKGGGLRGHPNKIKNVFCAGVVKKFHTMNVPVQYSTANEKRVLYVGQTLRISFVVCKHTGITRASDRPEWTGWFKEPNKSSDFVVFLLLRIDNTKIEKIYLIPTTPEIKRRVYIHAKDLALIEQHQHKNTNSVCKAIKAKLVASGNKKSL